MFEIVKKEKELALREEQIKLEQERLAQEEEEIKKIRAESHFIATPVKMYGNKLPSVEEKTLTIPQGPELSTTKRALFKEGVEIEM